MSTKATPKAIQQALITDEDLSASLACLVPVSSRITDSAATFIDKASKLLYDDKVALSTTQLFAVQRAIDVAQQVVKEGSAVNRLLRNPEQARDLVMNHPAENAHE
ncbi:hypothetical protein [Bifidobacterium aerophilum]|uniref:Uncharacterized protein n=1 Tax=Bifidobacterium aerophilum TaxID=1798155 RepID=A0A6N9Z7G8_9BIFI|nr:hypothetical protein [Bifidobacterium aerophilum]NEG90582.1 hypothetical protein [Bifidobacterium aerophilum]